MPTEHIELTDQQLKFIREVVDTGEYQDTSDAIRAGLRLLKQHREKYQARLNVLRGEIQKGIDSYERGAYIELDSDEALDEFFAEVSRQGRERLAKEANGSPTTPES